GLAGLAGFEFETDAVLAGSRRLPRPCHILFQYVIMSTRHRHNPLDSAGDAAMLEASTSAEAPGNVGGNRTAAAAEAGRPEPGRGRGARRDHPVGVFAAGDRRARPGAVAADRAGPDA